MRKRNRKKNKLILLVLFFSIIAIGVGLYIALPNFETTSLEKAFEQFQAGQTNVIIGNQYIALDNPIMINNGNIYLPIDFVQQHIDPNVFWDKEEKVVTITNHKELIRLYPNKKTYEVNYKKHTIEHPIVLQNNIVYIPYTLLKEKYNIIAAYNEDTNILIVDDTTVAQNVGVITHSTTKLRTEPNIKSPALQTLYQNEQVITYASDSGWIQVRTFDGNIGYISEKHMKHLKNIEQQPIKQYVASPIKNPIQGPVVMVWDQVGKSSNFNGNQPKYTNMKGVNVISPTWFEFADANGKLNSVANQAYVEWAHSEGYQVWPLISHNFSNTQWTHEVLSSSTKRDRVIQQLVEYVTKYKVDGINIDIESLEKRTGIYWVQFMRELYPVMRELGVTVSTDIYVPSPWTVHYNRSEIAKVVDYLMIMAYDEHWSGSEEAGSVGSLPWVQLAIERTLDEVPAEKIILGVPFYTRLWKEGINEQGSLGLYSKALGMENIQKELQAQGITPIVDEQAGQHYAEYQQEDGVYKVWIEDEMSMKARANFISQYRLAGISGWKLGLETPNIWKVIANEIAGKQ